MIKQVKNDCTTKHHVINTVIDKQSYSIKPQFIPVQLAACGSSLSLATTLHSPPPAPYKAVVCTAHWASIQTSAPTSTL